MLNLIPKLILSLISCVSVSVTTSKPTEPYGPYCQIDIYSNVSKILRDFEEVCKIETTVSQHSSPREAIAAIREYACGCGGNAAYPDIMMESNKILIRVIKYSSP